MSDMSAMNQPNLNAMAKAVVEKYGIDHPPEIRFIDLASEVGELGKALLNSGEYGHNPIHPSQDIADEIGDVLFSLACIANSMGVDLGDAMQSATQKYHARFSATGSIGSRQESS